MRGGSFDNNERNVRAANRNRNNPNYDMVYFPGDDLLSALRPRGLPIGNLTSQFWANVYLNPFDHFVNRALRCSAYVRYANTVGLRKSVLRAAVV